MRLGSQRQPKMQVDEENPYWVSFSDIMAGLLVIFMLAAIALIIELTQKSEMWDEAIREIAKAEQVRSDLLREIESELNERSIPVRITDNDTVLRIPEDVLTFKQSSFDIPSDKHSREVALEIGQVLYQSITKDDRWQYLDTIFIEGHTDKVPYHNRKIKGNWGLSTFRAISVWDYWSVAMDKGKRLEDLRNHVGNKLFSVSGYAESRPVSCSNADPNVDNPELCPEGRIAERDSLQKNRRIDIRFTVRRPALEDYIEVKKVLD